MRSVTIVLGHALTIALLACAAVRPDASRAADADVARILAPSGHLRAGLYPGTPTSILPDGTDNPRGVGYTIGREMARRLHVDYEPVVFAKNAEVLDAVKTGAVDVAFTNASPGRAKDMDFGPVYLEIELGYLVPEGSRLSDVKDVDAEGRKVGVTAGSTSDATLGRELKNATLVRAPTLKDAIAMLMNHQIDAFATNKATLFEMAEQVPGSRVLEGRWGEEHHAIAIPKGRDAGLDFLRSFTADIRASGLVSAAAQRAGLKGVMTPEK